MNGLAKFSYILLGIGIGIIGTSLIYEHDLTKAVGEDEVYIPDDEPLDDEEEEEYEPEDVDYDELDFSEPEDEETFRAQKEEYYRQREIEQRPFVSWLISNCCKNISACLDILEDNIIKKPYYGMMIEFHRNAAKESADDPLSKLSYQREKRQLDKRLAKQKQKAND